MTMSEKAADMSVEKPPAAQEQSSASDVSPQAEKNSVGDKQDPFANLTEKEREIIERQLRSEEVPVSYFSLYRYASRMDLLVIFVSAFSSIAGGALLPLFTIIFGRLAETFKSLFIGTVDGDAFSSEVSKYTLYFIYLAVAQFTALYVGTVGFLYAGEHIAQKTREKYLSAILGQNIGFFDKIGAGEVTTRITADTNLIQDAISQKVGLTLQSISTFITAFVIGFILYWKLTLILSCTVVAITLDFGIGSTFLVQWSQRSLDSYALGGTVAEEVFSSVRNAVAFGTQDKLAKQYGTHTTEAEKWGLKSKTALGIMIGGMFMFVTLNYGLAFWMGSRFLVNGEVSLGEVLTTLLAIVFGAFGLGTVGPNVQAFTSGVAAARKIYSTIARKSPLDPYSDEGEKPEHVAGNVELRNIRHIYPSRPEVVVMDDVSLQVPAGKTTALVGASGSGKSTIIGLIERFYDPVGGEVFFDGRNIQQLNIRWLRQQMALVSQEPTLFAVSIFENIRHGLIGSPLESLGEEKVKELVVNAAKMANAHDFVSALPEGYDTNVGDRGFLLSGGQKQRIAIARAIVSDPKLLLLDEATSALDTKSEGVVQAALDRAVEGRTTIVIAHRLSTIKNADNIVVMSKGRIVEQGTHDELLKMQGTYSGLVMAQEIADSVENKTEAVTDSMAEPIEGPSASADVEKETALTPAATNTSAPVELKRTQTAKSASSLVLQRIVGQKKQEYLLWTLIKFIFSFNKKEWAIMTLGFAFCVVAGGGQPVQAVFFGNAIQALSLPSSQYDKLRADANYWSRWYLFLGLIMFVAYAGQLICFGYCAEKLTHRARDISFQIMLRQDIGFFDREENSAGGLTSFLSTETTFLEGLSGSTLGSFLSLVTTLVAALAVGIAFGWKLGLVCAATIPVLLACGFFRFWILGRFEVKAKEAYQSSASYACEATSAIRTVASLTREHDVWENYHAQLNRQGAKSLRSVAKSSILYAAAESLTLLVTALGFWYGSTLLASGEYGLLQFFVTFTAVIFSAQSAGTSFSFAPDFSKAIQAAAQMKRLFDRKPDIDVWSEEGKSITSVEGSLEFKDVHFRYPTRPDQPVLRGLSLKADPGQYVALVGASGCGKSTVIALIERFYDPLTGAIFVDSQDTTSLNLKEFRQKIALVSQEPTLYQGTIRDNILLGTHLDDVAEEDIVRVCKEANIYDFIMSLPDGFNTICGTKGTLLSGGQKQRVAIARALIRDPKILLLDEATSALDSESEKVVQAALDAAAKGRTTIVVAHRLSTIQNADLIYVLDGGRVVESGRHNDLLARRGRYFELVQLQSLRKVH